MVVGDLRKQGGTLMNDAQFEAFHGIDRKTAAMLMWAQGATILKPRARYPAIMVGDNYGRPAWDWPLYDRVDMGDGYRSADDGTVKGEFDV